jgi:hypothetical protein
MVDVVRETASGASDGGTPTTDGAAADHPRAGDTHPTDDRS